MARLTIMFLNIVTVKQIATHVITIAANGTGFIPPFCFLTSFAISFNLLKSAAEMSRFFLRCGFIGRLFFAVFFSYVLFGSFFVSHIS